MTLFSCHPPVTRNGWTKQLDTTKRILLRPRSAGGARITYRIVYLHRLLFAFGRLNQHTKREGLNFNNTRNWGSMLRMEVNYYVMEWLVYTIPSRRRQSCDQAGLHRNVPPFPPPPHLVRMSKCRHSMRLAWRIEYLDGWVFFSHLEKFPSLIPPLTATINWEMIEKGLSSTISKNQKLKKNSDPKKKSTPSVYSQSLTCTLATPA